MRTTTAHRALRLGGALCDDHSVASVSFRRCASAVTSKRRRKIIRWATMHELHEMRRMISGSVEVLRDGDKREGNTACLWWTTFCTGASPRSAANKALA